MLFRTAIYVAYMRLRSPTVGHHAVARRLRNKHRWIMAPQQRRRCVGGGVDSHTHRRGARGIVLMRRRVEMACARIPHPGGPILRVGPSDGSGEAPPIHMHMYAFAA